MASFNKNSEIKLHYTNNNACFSCMLCTNSVLGSRSMVKLFGERKTKFLINALCKLLKVPNEPWYQLLRYGDAPNGQQRITEHDIYYCANCIDMLTEVELTMEKLQKLQSKIAELEEGVEREIIKSFEKKESAHFQDVEYSRSIEEVRKQLIGVLRERNKTHQGQDLRSNSISISTDPESAPGFERLSCDINYSPVNCNAFQTDPNSSFALPGARINFSIDIKQESGEETTEPYDSVNLESPYFMSDDILFPENTNDFETEGPQGVKRPATLATEDVTEDDPLWEPESNSLSSDEGDAKFNEIEASAPPPSKKRKSNPLTDEMRIQLLEEIQSGRLEMLVMLERVEWDEKKNQWILPRLKFTECDMTWNNKKHKKIVTLKKVKGKSAGSAPKRGKRTLEGGRLRKTRQRRIKLISECGEIFPCPECNIRFDTERRRDAHYLRVHKNDKYPFKCKLCTHAYRTARGLEPHVLLHTGEKPFVCEQCESSFRSEGNLKAHVANRHDIGPRFKCQICSKALMNATNLKNHMELHEDKKFLCEFCSTAFRRNPELQNHQQKCHAEELNLLTNSEFRCKICSKYFHDKFYLKRHEKLHTGEGVPYHCPICPYKCFGKHRFKLHEERHKDSRVYKCTHPGCSADYNNPGQLILHKRIHTGERPYACTMCSSKFRSSTTRKNHILAVHTKADNIKCEICGQGFPLRKYLNRHLLKHKSGKIPPSAIGEKRGHQKNSI